MSILLTQELEKMKDLKRNNSAQKKDNDKFGDEKEEKEIDSLRNKI